MLILPKVAKVGKVGKVEKVAYSSKSQCPGKVGESEVGESIEYLFLISSALKSESAFVFGVTTYSVLS